MKAKLIVAIFVSSLWAVSPVNAEQGIGFAGQEQSESTGLSYCRARFYDPETGTFISKDPSGVVDGPNMYQYSHSNPVNKIDRTGHIAETVWDVVNLGIGLGSLGYNVWNGKWGDAAFDVAGLVYDGVATAVPFLPAGASAALKAGRGAETALTIATTLKKTEIAVIDVAEQSVKKSADFSAQRFGSLVHDQVDFSHLKNWDVNVRPGNKGVDFLSPDKSWMMDITTFKNWPQHNKYPDVTDTIVGLLYERQSGVVGVGTGLFQASNTGGRLYAGAGLLNGAWALGGYIQEQSGVLIDKAAELVGSNLADIKGATYDPVSNQIIFLGSNSTPGVEGIDMDYFYTAVQAVYGSAIPPYVSLDAPASAASLWQDLGDGDGSFEPQEWGGFSLRYNPLWSGEDGNVAVRVRCRIGATAYDFNVNFAPQTIDWLQYPNGQYPMHLVFAGITGNAPPGIGVWDGPFTTLPFPQTVLDYVNTSSNVNGGQDWTYPFQLYNGGTGTITNISFAVIPDRQHRRFGGRLEGTKLGWVLQEADRIMKCLAIGTDNVTGATYTSATVPTAGYKNLAEINAAGTSVSGNTRVWFLADQMKLKRHVDPATGRATIVFDQAVVGVKTESALNFQAQSPGVAAFASHLQTNFDAFAALTFPVVSPDDPTGQTVINVKIFKMLKDAMQAVSLARFFRDNNIPLDMWWMNSWEPPTAYSPRSVATITNSSLGIVLYGGVDNRKVNTYTPSTNAQSVGMAIASARPNAPVNPTEDIKEQAWTASTVEGTVKAVAASVESAPSDGIVNLAETDLSFASPGALPLEFTRYYQSGYLGGSDLGPGWRVGRYVLEFERPSWFDENNMMTYFGNQLIPRAANSDTRLRSGSVRLVDLATGATLDFDSSFVVNYYQDVSGNPRVSLAGLSIEELPVFTAGKRQDGTVLVQNDDGVLGYTAYLPDGSALVFDPEGRLEITQDRHGYAQWYFRNGEGKITIIEDSAARRLTLSYDPTSGQLSRVVGPQNERMDYGYDGNGRLETVTHQRSGAAIARYTYNAQNQLLDVTRFDDTKLVTTTPDIKGRSDERKDSRSNNFDFSFWQSGDTKTTQVQDDASVFGPSETTTDAEGRTTSVADPLDNTTVFGYEGDALLPNTVQLPTPDRPAISIERNANEQPTTITDPAIPGALPISMGYTAANRVDWVTDEAGRLLDAVYDPVTNDLTKLRRFLSGSPVEIGYGYVNGYLRTITDARNKVWTIGRDIYGRVTGVTDPTNVTVGYEYDALGRLWRITDPRLSSAITYTFDDLDRIKTVTTPAGTTTYTYDPITKWLKTMTDVGNRTVTFEHDPENGDITKAIYAMPQEGGGTANVTTDFSYTRFGELQTVAAPGAQPTTFQIDDLGRLTGTTEVDAGIFDAPQGFVSNNATSGAWTKNKNHTFTWGAPESSSPVDGYSLAQDATPGLTVTTTSPTATWNNVADGQHTAQVRAKNVNGFWSPAAVFNLWVDAALPTISGVTASPNPVPQSPGVVTISATVSDALSGLASGYPKVRWCISADASRNWSAFTSMTSAGANQWTSSISQNGAQASGQVFYYEIQALDVAGNTASNNGSLPMTFTGGGAGVDVMPLAGIIGLLILIFLTANRFLPRRNLPMPHHARTT